MTDHAEDIHQGAYQAGFTPLEWAEHLITEQIRSHHHVIAAIRKRDTAQADTVATGLGADITARRILAQLLDAGWTMPTPKETP